MSGSAIGDGGADLVYKSIMPGNLIMPQSQHYFLKEQAFTQSKRYIFGADETKWFLLDPTNYVPDSGQEFNNIIAEVPSFFAEAGPLEVTFYVNPVLGAAVATPLSPGGFNRASFSTRTPQLELSSLNIAPGGGLGTCFSELLIPSTATGAGQQVGFSVEEQLPIALNLANTTLMTVKNLNGADTHVGIRINWFEI
jgi:hypothetical protein